MQAQMQAEKRQWLKWVEPWYLVYAIMGLVVAGLTPVLIPLVAGRSGNAGQVGLVVAAVSLGGLTAPLWGGLADRYRAHRLMLAGGMVLACLGLAAFPFTAQAGLWVLLAALAGLGSASAATVANLFVVEAHPKAEWDERIGWLQTFYGVGQVAGLLLAGAFSRMDLRIGLLAAGGLSAAAALLGWLTTQTPPAPVGTKALPVHPARHVESAASSPQRLSHTPKWLGMPDLGRTLRSPYGIFLVTWLLAFAGPAAVFSQYPLFMQKVFGVAPDTSSAAFAVIAGLGLALYTPAGNWSTRRGPRRILQVSLGLRLLAFTAMLGLVFVSGSGTVGWLALLAFAFVVWAWSLMSVSGTDLAARLSPSGEGQGLGIFNAMTAVAGILGALLGGWVAGAWGYGSIAGLALGGVALGLGLSLAGKHGIASSRKPQKSIGARSTDSRNDME